jgi:hypothetical protein
MIHSSLLNKGGGREYVEKRSRNPQNAGAWEIAKTQLRLSKVGENSQHESRNKFPMILCS